MTQANIRNAWATRCERQAPIVPAPVTVATGATLLASWVVAK